MNIQSLIQTVDEDRLRRNLFYLASDPLPFRKLNYTVPGHTRCTLYEADDWIAGQLAEWGYPVEREGCPVRAFGYDATKPLHHRYTRPEPNAPVYTAYNLYARKRGVRVPDETIVVLAHKDSQSWVDSPGGYDNGAGTVAVLELARVLAAVEMERSLCFLFCNEEHLPWTSVVAAQGMRRRGERLAGVFNVDGIGGKSEAEIAAGQKTNATLYTQPEGKRLADLMTEVNDRYRIRLKQQVYQRERPGDDDGSFIHAGFGNAIANLGSWPYSDAQYHLPGDVPERVDFENVRMATQATLAAILTLDWE